MTKHDDKSASLEPFRSDASGQHMTTNQGVRVSDDHNSLKGGPRGPTLIEDFIFREKMTHFDHERIPERVVHARGSGAFGYFECTEDLSSLTRARFLTRKGHRTSVFVRFSTVAGSRGSSDTVRDVRGFAVKFYTDEGVFDLVGNNIPVFFIQDATKFPDLVHAAKPEPHNEIPQAQTAHDTFWDFISLMPESLHMVMWIMSDRAIPRSFRMMEGFGVHTFRLVNDQGKAHFVKFHWKPRLGIHGLAWDEASTLAGKDPDFHRRDLWEAIDQGNFPEWELGLQVVPEEDEHKFSFDLLDATKIIPEELVPVRRVGRLVLDRNPDNFFAETEQAAFHVGNVVDGIDFTNDPLLQGRLFSYTDTQLIRLGGPNFHQIPVNRSIAPVHNNQRDGYHQHVIHKGRASYDPNSLGKGCPMHTPEGLRGFVHYAEKIDAHKVRARSQSFSDHVSQAQLFYRSQTSEEQQHIAEALRFELSKVQTMAVRERMVGLLNHVDDKLAAIVAQGVGLNLATIPPAPLPPNPADPTNTPVPPNRATPTAQRDDLPPKASPVPLPARSDALSMVLASPPVTIATRKVAILLADGFNAQHVAAVRKALKAEGAMGDLVAPLLGPVASSSGTTEQADFTLESAASQQFDAVFIVGGAGSAAALRSSGDALRFVAQAFKHCKPVAAVAEGVDVLAAAPLAGFPVAAGAAAKAQHGVVTGPESALDDVIQTFAAEAKKHRFWSRPGIKAVPVLGPNLKVGASLRHSRPEGG